MFKPCVYVCVDAYFFFDFDLLLGAGGKLVEVTLEARDEAPEFALLLPLTLSSALFYDRVSIYIQNRYAR